MRDRRWISSMKSTSPVCRLVRIAARSPMRSIAGPDVTRMLTPISAAMMYASVVLPRPGGPYSSTWSSGSPRCARRLDADADVVLDLLLVDVLGEPLRAQRRIRLQVAVLRLASHDALGSIAGHRRHDTGPVADPTSIRYTCMNHATHRTGSPLNVLFAAVEMSPLAKVGGLGDVAGSLPRALRANGDDVRVAMPMHGAIERDGAQPHAPARTA